MAPRFSVIVPLIEHRGLAYESLAAWGSRQTLPRRDYEVIAVTRGAEPEMERDVAVLLGPGDRLLKEAGANRSRLYDLGARGACGEFVLFTESHCLPQPDCLAELARFFDTNACDGACCQSLGIAARFQDRQDRRMFEEGFRVFVQPGDWRKVNIHGFALRRQVYLDVGGLPHRYAGFAEMMLAATLRDRGVRLGFAEKAIVRHGFRATFADNEELIDFYVAGESLYRAEHPGPDAIGHTFLPHDLPVLPSRRAALWRSLAVTLGRELLTRAGRRDHPSTFRAFVQAAAQALGPASLGWAGDRWQAASAQWLARGRYWLWCWHPARRAAAYRDWVYRAHCRSRIRFLLQHPLPPAPLRTTSRLGIAEIDEEHLIGFHALETYQGQAFRWTGPAAVLRLAVPPGDGELRLETNNVRREPVPLDLRVFVNGRRLPPTAVTVEPDGIRFPRPCGPLHTFALTCRPLQPWKRGIADRRELGLPLFAVEVLPRGAGMVQ